MTAPREKSGAVLIKEFFDLKAGEAIKEIKTLTPEDREQIISGLRDGSLTY